MKERYTKTKWVDGKTCVNAANLNKIESGIENLYHNAIGESQLQEGDGISLSKDPMTGNITVGIKEENNFINSSAVGRIEVVNSMPANPDLNCMYFIKDPNSGRFDLVFGGINLLSTSSSADIPLPKLSGEVEVTNNGDGTFSVSYSGNEGVPEIVVYINGVPKEDPEDFILVPGLNTFEVHVRIEGYEEIIEEYEIEYTPALPELESTGNISITADELYSRNLTITYNGSVSDVEISVEGEGIQVGIENANHGRGNFTISKEILLPDELGPHAFTVTLTAEGYQSWIYETSWELRGKRTDPEITIRRQINGNIEVHVSDFTVVSITINGNTTTYDNNFSGRIIEKTYEDQHVIVTAQNVTDSTTPYLDSSDQVQQEFDLLAKPKIPSQSAEFNFELNEDGLTAEFSAEGPNVRLYSVDSRDEVIENPVIFNRPGLKDDPEVIPSSYYYAKTLEQGEQYSETTTWYESKLVIPNQERSMGASLNVTEGDETYTIDFYGNITRVYLDTTLISLPYPVKRIREDQTLTFTVYTKDETKIENETILQVTVPRILVTETPVITTEENDEAVIVTATGAGNVTLSTVGGEIVENPYTIEKTTQPQTITFMAVAKEEGKLISNAAVLKVTVPAIEFKLEVLPQYWFNDAENIDERFDLTNNLTISESKDLVIEISYITNDPDITEEITLVPSNTSSAGEMKQNLTNLVEEGRMTEEQYEQYQEQFMRLYGFYPVLWYEKSFTFYSDLEQLGENNYTLTMTITPSERFGGESQQRTQEINFSHLIKQVPTTPVISTETTAEGVSVNINWGNSDGNRIYTGEGVYDRMDDSYEVEVEAYVEGSNSFYETEHVIETIQIPALIYAPEPTFNWTEQPLSTIVSATCENHEVILMLDGDEVENPYEIDQIGEEQTLTFSAYTVANEGGEVNSNEVESEEIVVPAVEKRSLIASKSYINENPSLLIANQLKWTYQAGLTILAMTRTHECYQSVDDGIISYALKYYHSVIDSRGIVAFPTDNILYDKNNYNLDHVQPGYNLFYLYGIDSNTTYKGYYEAAIETLAEQLRDQPRLTSVGTSHPYYHKAIYPHQTWLDGVYMSKPFRTLRASINEELSEEDRISEYNDIVGQIIDIANLTYDAETKLYRHAYSEDSTVGWVDHNSVNGGQSYFAWGRALGWYIMGIEEVLDQLPEEYSRRQELITILQNLCTELLKWRDEESGTWRNLLTEGTSDSRNIPEATSSCMFAYGYLHGVRKGYLSEEMEPYAKDIFKAVVKTFVTIDDENKFYLRNCASAGNPGKDCNNRGQVLENYYSKTMAVNDPHGVGPFILASLEYEQLVSDSNS